MISLKITNKPQIASITVVVVLYVAFHLFFHLQGFNFLNNTDAGWYYKIVINPLVFDPAIQPLFPFLTRLFIELFGLIISDYIMMNLVNFTFLIGYIMILNKVLSYLYKEYTTLDVILVFSLPLFSYFMTFMPRANSMLYLTEFSIIFLVMKNQRGFLFYFLVAILPLIHKSAAFFIPALVLFEIFNKTFSIKGYLIASLPFIVYLLFGSFLQHDDLFWWFTGYKDNSSILNIPFFNGLADNLYTGVEKKNYIDLLQAILILTTYFLYFYFLIKGIIKKDYISILFYLPGIVILPLLPKAEINAFVNYTYFGFLGLYIDLRKMNTLNWRSIKYLTLSLVCFVQLFYCVYNYHILK